MKILVVDDNKAFSENLKDILETYGHFVQTAGDGFDSLEKIQQDRPDLVLLDLKLPRMNGADTFKKIKGIASSVRVIMMTGYTKDTRIQTALQEGVCAALEKPLDFENLLALINKIAGSKK